MKILHVRTIHFLFFCAIVWIVLFQCDSPLELTTDIGEVVLTDLDSSIANIDYLYKQTDLSLQVTESEAAQYKASEREPGLKHYQNNQITIGRWEGEYSVAYIKFDPVVFIKAEQIHAFYLNLDPLIPTDNTLQRSEQKFIVDTIPPRHGNDSLLRLPQQSTPPVLNECIFTVNTGVDSVLDLSTKDDTTDKRAVTTYSYEPTRVLLSDSTTDNSFAYTYHKGDDSLVLKTYALCISNDASTSDIIRCARPTLTIVYTKKDTTVLDSISIGCSYSDYTVFLDQSAHIPGADTLFVSWQTDRYAVYKVSLAPLWSALVHNSEDGVEYKSIPIAQLSVPYRGRTPEFENKNLVVHYTFNTQQSVSATDFEVIHAFSPDELEGKSVLDVPVNISLQNLAIDEKVDTAYFFIGVQSTSGYWENLYLAATDSLDMTCHFSTPK
jgi:hypothetical protein